MDALVKSHELDFILDIERIETRITRHLVKAEGSFHHGHVGVARFKVKFVIGFYILELRKRI